MNKILIFATLFFLVYLTACCKQQEDTSTECQAKCNIGPTPSQGLGVGIRYYFDKNEKKCKPFYWSGDDVVVLFETLLQCESCGCK